MLDEYKRKRNFKATPEPDGIKKDEKTSIPHNHNLPRPKPRFVIQRHEATRLHYDFRLESLTENVLLSWAVPKGPSLDPSKKRLAIQTEDHPVDYLLFEGIIPEGNYGAGTVIVWDTGEYSLQKNTLSKPTTTTMKYTKVSKFENEDEDASELLRKNDKITFTLYGQKLRGMFSLIRTKTEKQWLLIKLNDEFANGLSSNDKSNDTDITEIRPESVLTGRTNRELLQYKFKKSSSKNDIKGQGFTTRDPFIETTTSSDIPSTNLDTKNPLLKQSFFEFSKPMLSSLANKPFDNKNWVFEIKWDGVRAIALVNMQDNNSRLISRSGDIITHRYPEIEKTLKFALNEEIIKDFAILDGEIVVLDKEGYPNFQNHQKRMNIDSLKSIEVLSNLYPAVYYVFDILYLDNNNLKELPFIERRKILSSLIKRDNEKIRLSDYIEEFGINVFETIKNMNLEGVIAKHKSSKYYSGLRSKDWLKIKNIKTQDCIVIGYTKGEGNRKDYFGSLLLAAIDNNNNIHQSNMNLETNENNTNSEDTSQLRFIGHTGSGFNFENLHIIYQKLREIEISYCPIKSVPYLNRETVWVKPITVIEVKFNDWTNNKIMRAPIFLRIRNDKPSSQCIIEINKKASNDSVSNKNKIQVNDDETKMENSSQVIDNNKSFSHLKKEFWKATKDHPAITKGDLIDYYDKMNIHLLPLLQDRPLSLSRYPDGIYGKAFYQKDWKFDKPTYVKTVQVYSESSDDENINYIVCNNNETLLWLANLGCIEIHPWNSRVNNYSQCKSMDTIESQECGLNYPDFIVFDLDPYINVDNENSSKEPAYSLEAFKQTVQVAYSLRDIFDALNIRSFVKTSGKTGLHIFLPIINLYSFKQSREFAKIISQILKRRLPGKITTEWKTTDRKGKVFFDYNQNSIGKTLASIFSVRPIENAPVSVPLKWEELSDIRPTDFTITTVPDLYKRKINPWKDILSCRQNLEKILDGISDFKV
jgi:bifunctional non-homologous end joining protein LigD